MKKKKENVLPVEEVEAQTTVVKTFFFFYDPGVPRYKGPTCGKDVSRHGQEGIRHDVLRRHCDVELSCHIAIDVGPQELQLVACQGGAREQHDEMDRWIDK